MAQYQILRTVRVTIYLRFVVSNNITYTVYALVCPTSGNVRYVGYTKKKLSNRLYYHYNDAKKGIKSHKTNWLNSLPAPALIIPIEEGIPTVEQAVQSEIKWISSYSNLTNSTSGGETSKTYRLDVRKKMSEARIGKMTGKDNPAWGLKRADLTKRNIENNPAKLPGVAERIGKVLKEKYSTQEYKDKFVTTQLTRKIVLQLSMNGELIKEWPSINRARVLGGFGQKEIINCCKGRCKQHKGFIWQYK